MWTPLPETPFLSYDPISITKVTSTINTFKVISLNTPPETLFSSYSLNVTTMIITRKVIIWTPIQETPFSSYDPIYITNATTTINTHKVIV